MGSYKPLVVCVFAMAIASCGGHAPHSARDQTVYARYSAIYLEKDGDVDSAGYGIGADGSNYIPRSDVVMSVKFCPRDSPFICVHGEFYDFAVPRHDLTAGEKWRFAGRTYEVVPGFLPHAIYEQPVHSKDVDRTFVLFNSEINVNVIRTVTSSKGRTCIDTYLYSHAHGVLGDLGRCDDIEKNEPWTYWLIGTDGVGSPVFEKAISSKALMTQAEAVALHNQ